ncbi:helix-turn-helix domain-containing protein [Actinomadura macra]|uniref:helix-turn-helix domain-containing protein n=1 Tax=Actinomadura macra TaxID=46164 RepID=UPI0008361F4C|nr:helix-turn-helix transcriptional regulator [Actinomadura macra]
MDLKGQSTPLAFWSTPTVAAALATCDFPTLMDEVRRVRRWTQTDLAIALGYSQSWISKVLRHAQPLTIDQVRDISRQLGIPLQLLRFGDVGGDDPTKRRDFSKALALALLPLPTHAEFDETTAPTLTAITGSQRRLDPTTPARELARGVVAHVELADRRYNQGGRSPFASDIAAAVSEAAGFAAWLHTDMHDIGTARTYYRMAINRARQAGHDLLTAYMLGSLATFEVEAEDPDLGIALIAEARKQIGPRPHATPSAWLASLEALAHAATQREGRDARSTEALLKAEHAIEEDRSAATPWPWVFPFDNAKLAGYRALVSVRLNLPSQALTAFAESLTSTQPAPKQRAAVMLEVATAVRQGGEQDRDTSQADEAFQLGIDALKIGTTYASERVIQRARRFRREYSGPTTPKVREFDRHLRATLL